MAGDAILDLLLEGMGNLHPWQSLRVVCILTRPTTKHDVLGNLIVFTTLIDRLSRRNHERSSQADDV